MSEFDDDDDLLCMQFLDGNNDTGNEPNSFHKKTESVKDQLSFLSKEVQNEVKVASKPKISYKELGSGRKIIVNPDQKKNPLLDYIKTVPWQFASSSQCLVMDFITSETSCCLYLSVRYHAQHDNYIYERIKRLKQVSGFQNRFLLCFVDHLQPDKYILALTRLCEVSDLVLLLAFSLEEAANYLETFKTYEGKPADLIKEKIQSNINLQVLDALQSIRRVNSTDSQTLLSNFGTIAGVADASQKNLAFCFGIGAQKAKNIHELFRQPFLKE